MGLGGGWNREMGVDELFTLTGVAALVDCKVKVNMESNSAKSLRFVSIDSNSISAPRWAYLKI